MGRIHTSTDIILVKWLEWLLAKQVIEVQFLVKSMNFSQGSAKAEHDLSSLFCVCVCVCVCVCGPSGIPPMPTLGQNFLGNLLNNQNAVFQNTTKTKWPLNFQSQQNHMLLKCDTMLMKHYLFVNYCRVWIVPYY